MSRYNAPSDTTGRVLYIDYAKALGMLLIIWGHVKLTGVSNEFVYAFHIPLFFFLSGMVFNRDRYVDFGHFLSKKVRSLLIPYAVFSLLTWILWVAYSFLTHADVDSIWRPLLQTFIAQGSGGFLVHNVPLWFVTCLFVVEMIYWFVSKLKDSLNVTLCVVLAIVGFCLDNRCDVWDFRLMPWSIDVAMMAIIFFALGNQIVKHVSTERFMGWVDSHRLLSWLWVIVGFALTAFIGHLNGAVSMGHARLGNNPFVFYFGAFSGTFAMLVLCMLLTSINENHRWDKLSSRLAWFGQHSFDAMAIHNPIRQIVMVVVAIALQTTSDGISENNLQSLLSFVATLAVTVVGILIIQKIRMRTKHQDIIKRKSPLSI